MTEDHVKPHHRPPRDTVIALNTKGLATTQTIFDALTAHDVGVVKVAAPTFDDNWDLLDCTCTPTSETRRLDPEGRCMSPGKHPMGRDWQKYATKSWKGAQVWLTVEGHSLGLYPLPGCRIVGLDEDIPETLDDVPDWESTLGDATSIGKRHAFFVLPPGFDATTLGSRWSGGDLLHWGVVRQFVAPNMLHPTGRRVWNGITEIKPISEKTLREIGALRSDGPPIGAHGKGAFIVIDGGETYEIPDSIPLGGRHDAITAFVASRWNRGLTYDEVLAEAKKELPPRFDEPMHERRFDFEVRHAWNTAGRKWKEPAGVTTGPIAVVPPPPAEDDDEPIIIDPLDVGTKTMAPVEPLDLDKMWLPSGLVGLMEYFTDLGDAPFSSLLLASCVTMSALVGPQPSLRWRGRNRAALFGVLVGDSNYGRKGQTLRLVERAFSQAEPLLREITRSGVASDVKLIDLLVESKTLTFGSMLIKQAELATVLTIAGREGTNMSAVLREIWDGDDVQTHSRKSGSVIARDYHVAMIGATNPKDLVKHLTAEDLANGWANRFLWFWSEPPRPVEVPDMVDDTLSPSLAKHLSSCIEYGRSLGKHGSLVPSSYTMTLEEDAAARLSALNAAVDKKPRHWVDILRQRMPHHAARLAMVSALFERRAVITLDDVGFGEAMTDYAVRSTRAVFGTRVSDPLAAMILTVLAQSPDGWLNTSTIAKACKVAGERANRSLDLLVDAALIVREKRSTAGAPALGYRRVDL
jgi:hypothetical protein